MYWRIPAILHRHRWELLSTPCAVQGSCRPTTVSCYPRLAPVLSGELPCAGFAIEPLTTDSRAPQVAPFEWRCAWSLIHCCSSLPWHPYSVSTLPCIDGTLVRTRSPDRKSTRLNSSHL